MRTARADVSEAGPSLARSSRRVAAVVAVADLLAVAVTLAVVRDAYVAWAAGFSALVAVVYLLRMTEGAFDPYGSIALLGWTLVSATMSPGSIVGQGVCVAGMTFVLATSVSPGLARRRYTRFMARATDATA